MIEFSSQGYILLWEDFNARIGKYQDYIPQNTSRVINEDKIIPDDYQNHTPRNNYDNILNSHGKKILQVSKTLDLGGRINGDTLGKVTYHGKNGVSTPGNIISDQICYQISNV